MQRWISGIFGIAFIASLSARESFYTFSTPPSSEKSAWFTGPLLTPSGHVVPEGHQNYEPYVYWTQITDSYDSHWKAHSVPTFNNVLFQTTMQFGIMPYTEFDMAPQFLYNETRGQHMWRASDLPMTLAFQLLRDTPDKWYPAIKLRFSANVPLGKYDHLNPKKLETDAGGIGNWLPSVALVFTRLHHITGHQYLSWRLFFNYAFSTHVNVRGLSIYGGTPTTRGTVHPGNIFTLLYGMEYSLTQNWVFALDFQYQHNNKRTFSGRTPFAAKPISPSKELFALAPAIEYNWSENLGIIAGPWFTFAGRNTTKFISYVIALNIYN